MTQAVEDTDYQGVLLEGAFVDGDKSKLDGIEASADVTDATNVTTALSTISIDALSDVDSDKSKTPADGDVLTFDGTDWNAEAPAGGGGGQTLYDIIVDASGGGDYTTIDDALDNVTTGQTIFIKSGTYTLAATRFFTTAEVYLIGEDNMNTTIDIGTYVFSFSPNNGSFSNLNCQISTGRFQFSGNDMLIKDCVFESSGLGRAIYGSGPRIIFTNNRFIGTNTTSNDSSDKISFDGADQIITDNDFAGSARSRDFIVTNGNFSIFSNNKIRITSSTTSTTRYAVYGGVNTFISDNIITTSSPSTPINGIYGNIVKDNWIENFYYSISTTSSDNGVIENNFIKSTNTTVAIIGIKTQSNNDFTHIKDNYIFGNTQSSSIGIQVQSGDVFITGNVVTRIVKPLDNTAGSANNCIITNNDFSGGNNISINNPKMFKNNRLSDVPSISLTSLSENVDMSGNYPTSAIVESQVYRMKNTSGSTINAGDLVVYKAVAAGDEITTTTTGGDNKVFGMATQSISNNAYGIIKVKGSTKILKVDGTTDIAIGDYISTFTTAGIGQKAASGDTAIAIALEAYTADDSLGVIDALIISPLKI